MIAEVTLSIDDESVQFASIEDCLALQWICLFTNRERKNRKLDTVIIIETSWFEDWT